MVHHQHLGRHHRPMRHSHQQKRITTLGAATQGQNHGSSRTGSVGTRQRLIRLHQLSQPSHLGRRNRRNRTGSIRTQPLPRTDPVELLGSLQLMPRQPPPRLHPSPKRHEGLMRNARYRLHQITGHLRRLLLGYFLSLRRTQTQTGSNYGEQPAIATSTTRVGNQ
jgi:hypothetical protein